MKKTLILLLACCACIRSQAQTPEAAAAPAQTAPQAAAPAPAAPAPGGYYNFGKIMLDGMVYDVPEPKEEMENEDADDPPAQR